MSVNYYLGEIAELPEILGTLEDIFACDLRGKPNNIDKRLLDDSEVG